MSCASSVPKWWRNEVTKWTNKEVLHCFRVLGFPFLTRNAFLHKGHEISVSFLSIISNPTVPHCFSMICMIRQALGRYDYKCYVVKLLSGYCVICGKKDLPRELWLSGKDRFSGRERSTGVRIHSVAKSLISQRCKSVIRYRTQKVEAQI